MRKVLFPLVLALVVAVGCHCQHSVTLSWTAPALGNPTTADVQAPLKPGVPSNAWPEVAANRMPTAPNHLRIAR